MCGGQRCFFFLGFIFERENQINIKRGCNSPSLWGVHRGKFKRSRIF